MKKLGPVSIAILAVCGVVFAYVSWHEYNVEQGRKAYRKYGCAQCHEAGAAPDLAKLKGKLDRDFIARFVENPETVYREKGHRPLNEGYVPMPVLHVSHDEARQIADFLMDSQ